MKNKNLIWGLFFILAGVALILDTQVCLEV